MKVPRDLGADDLARVLRRYGYEVTRQTGSHIRLTSALKGSSHHITIPRHAPLKAGTLNGILKDIAAYLEIDRTALLQALFG
jgi:predicted RNA binding protein YcfA (HicA-like mRNA interferase family)